MRSVFQTSLVVNSNTTQVVSFKDTFIKQITLALNKEQLLIHMRSTNIFEYKQ